MLKFFRTKGVTKFVLWMLLILILPAFVLWGSATLSRSREKGPAFVGFLDSKKISFDALYESMLGVKGQLMLNYWDQPESIKEITGNKAVLARIAWDRLIMLKEAEKNKIVVTDKEVAAYLRSHPLFLRNGYFDERIYGYILQYNIGLTPRAFEEIVRKNLKIAKLKAAVVKDAAVTDEEASKEFKEEFKDSDEEAFKEKKEEFSKKVLDKKRTKVLAEWFLKLSQRAKLNIELNAVDKYYE